MLKFHRTTEDGDTFLVSRLSESSGLKLPLRLIIRDFRPLHKASIWKLDNDNLMVEITGMIRATSRKSPGHDPLFQSL